MIGESFAKWFARFIEEHLDRIVFAAIVLGLAAVVNFGFGKPEEALNVTMLIIGAFMPKIRTPKQNK